jgi:hypothetical protein
MGVVFVVFLPLDFQLQFTRFVASAYKSLQAGDCVFAASGEADC